MKNRLAHVFAAGALAAGLAFAQAQAPTPQPGEGRQAGKAARRHHRGNHFERLATQLNLTPQQREQAKALMERARADSAPIREQLRTSRRQLHEAIKSGNQAEIQRLSTHIGALRGQLVAIHAKAMQEGYAMLTPEQRQKAEELHGKMMQRFGRRTPSRS